MFPNLLDGKKILLGVTASISVYKSLELIRLYIKSGAQVRVVMSESAKKFITPLTFETISQNRALHDETESWDGDLNHIKIGEWADLFVLAPASANTMAKLSQGIADNLLLQTALAYPRQRLLCPAANTNMINSPMIINAMKILENANYTIMSTQVKNLACNTVGDGALIDIEDIYFKTAQMLLENEYWSGRQVVISAGGTIEKLDDVRYLSNFSSGKMGASLALALFFKGADVHLVSTRFPERLPHTMRQTAVQSSVQMLENLNGAILDAKQSSKQPFIFMAAAVSDYVPATSENGKIKKANLGDTWTLELKQNQDILAQTTKEGIYTIGFKAEMDSKVGLDNAKSMLDKKGLDAVCYNLLQDSSSFGTDDNAIEFITKETQTSLDKQDKLSLSLGLVELCESL